MVATNTKKREQWRVYKPRKTNDGAASKLEMKIVTEEKEKDGKKFTVRDVQLFWVATQQTGTDTNGNASFGWDDPKKSVTLKLGEVDLGELLAVLNGSKKHIGAPKNDKGAGGLFHKNDKGSTAMTLERGDSGYSLLLSKKVGKDAPVRISHQVTIGEGEVLKVVLEAAIRQSYQW